ncbi:MAG TPA: hypothetical protein PKY31_07520, partial [Spirochaetota bacterium]|nr:hypothetical protein [Spirochaetota bacterium]
MRRRIVNMALIALLLAADAYFITEAMSAARRYPFSRTGVGGELYFRTSIMGAADPFGAKVVTVNGAPAGVGLFTALSRAAGDEVLSLGLEIRGVAAEAHYRPGPVNREFLWFLLILLLLANIHFIYGIMMRFFRWDNYQSKLFFSVSLAQSAFYFFSTDILSYSR